MRQAAQFKDLEPVASKKGQSGNNNSMAKPLDIGIGTEKTVFLGKKVQLFLLCCVLPTALNYFAYYGFITNYTKYVFTLYDFHRQYDHHIFRYRILGKLLLLGYYTVFTHFPHPFFKQMKEVNQYLLTDTTSLYHCYFLMNTFFLCLTTWVLSTMFRLKQFEGSSREKQLWLLLIIFLIIISQFVVTPYDTISYFFLSVSIYLMLRGQNGFVLAVLLGTMVLAALTRETAAISLSFYATLYLMRKALPNQTSLLGFVLLLVTFLATYVGLRDCVWLVQWNQRRKAAL